MSKSVGTGPSSYEKKNLPGRGLTKVEKHWSTGTGITLNSLFLKLRSAIAMRQEGLQCKPERQESCILHLQLLSKPNHTASHRRCCYCDRFPALLQPNSQYIYFVNVVFRTDWSWFVRPVHTVQCSCTVGVGCVPKDFAWFKISFSPSNKYKIGGLFLVAHKCSHCSVVNWRIRFISDFTHKMKLLYIFLQHTTTNSVGRVAQSV